ncbi:uncharacterized protein LOC124445316 [Xenia sp. Carnegie-2017]|uniref:uncharacterized protein LOC124445316 n=1 Tax=Xenia sp. Carnegie-2017 TaxID=2897299 RepID=UPI001F0362A8|nr:uncharacterized protein LOC124445316 [Xenia sp. Carnegie-2017]
MTTTYHLSDPLQSASPYDPSFKVDVQLDAPLRKVSLSLKDVSVEIMTICSQLESLCKQYTTKTAEISPKNKNKYHSSFEAEARFAWWKMEENLYFLPTPQPTLKEYLEKSGLMYLFPRVMSYIINPDGPSFFGQESLLQEHFNTPGVLNQIITLSNQLSNVAFNGSNHKYMAHQLALLYQSINQIHCPTLHEQKIEVKNNFREFKSKLTVKDKERTSKLPEDEKEWVKKIKKSILDEHHKFLR